MNCKLIQDELLLFVGDEHLPDELKRHLEACPECSAFFSELSALTDSLGADEDFYLSETEIEDSAVEVEKRIDKLELEKVTEVRSVWRTYVPAAAAVVLLVGMAFLIKMSGWLGNGTTADTITPDSALVTVAVNDLDNLQEDDYEYLLQSVSAGVSGGAGELVLDDLTEEELEYLEETFDVGEIL